MGEQVIASCYAVRFLFFNLFLMLKCMNTCAVLTKELQLEGTKSNPSKNENSI
jgi:hypothetical protein